MVPISDTDCLRFVDDNNGFGDRSFENFGSCFVVQLLEPFLDEQSSCCHVAVSVMCLFHGILVWSIVLDCGLTYPFITGMILRTCHTFWDVLIITIFTVKS